MRIYFLGICGTAMGNAAVLMKALGHEVRGADTGVYPPMSDVLASAGIDVYEGYDPARLEKFRPDFVVVGNALSRGNPEIEWLLNTRAFAYGSLPQLLRERILFERQNIVVAGTHGKTTTATLCACLLKGQGRDPGYLIGGVPLDLPSGAHAGAKADPFVIEGDEYDSAFFDKRSKFIHYLPSIALINNVEFDHVDIFRDLADVERTFSHFLRLVPQNGYVVANGDDEVVARLLEPVNWTHIVRVGVGEHCDVRIVNFKETREGAHFELHYKGKLLRTIDWALPGLFNARNAAMAATATALSLFSEGFERLDLSCLQTLRGVRRRQEVLYADQFRVVIEDFGHHPTAIAQTLESLKARYPNFAITACFEPRSNTARTDIFQTALPRALEAADAAFIGPVHRAEKLAADKRLDAEKIAAELKQKNLHARACATNDEVLEAAWDTMKDSPHPQLCVFFSNGAFGGIIPKLAARAKMAGKSLA